jgi:hypothetical protein
VKKDLLGLENTVTKRGTSKYRSIEERSAKVNDETELIRSGLLDLNVQMARLLDQHLPDWRERVTFPPTSE